MVAMEKMGIWERSNHKAQCPKKEKKKKKRTQWIDVALYSWQATYSFGPISKEVPKKTSYCSFCGWEVGVDPQGYIKPQQCGDEIGWEPRKLLAVGIRWATGWKEIKRISRNEIVLLGDDTIKKRWRENNRSEQTHKRSVIWLRECTIKMMNL